MTEDLGEKKVASRGARRFGRFVRRSWQGLLVGVLVLALGVLAVVSPGLVQADVRLDEGTVYAAKRSSGLIGTLNAQIDELAAATAVGDSEFRIMQDERLVVVHGTKSSTLVRYNPGRNRMESPTQLPSNAQVRLGGGTLLVVNPDNGRVWFGEADKVLKFDFQKEKAQLEVGEFGTATVTASGDVIGLNAQKSVLVRQQGESVAEIPLPFTLDPTTVSVELSAVGDKAVVLDRQSGRIWVEGMQKAFEVSGASTAKLVAPAPDALGGEDGAKAIYATQAGLIALTGDGPRSLSGNLGATPIEPIQLGTCVYAAFGDRFVKKCRGSDAEIRDIPQLPADAELAFQINRTTVALNDVVSGTLWMVNKDMLRITDWDRVAPQKADEENENTQTETVIPPDRSKPNEPPIAKDDSLAARAGRSTTLTVLDNDTDPDGDVLTISAPANVQGATLQTVRGGSGLQITVDSEAKGSIAFTYTVDDGRGGKSSANVTVRVLAADPKAENAAPNKHPLAQDPTIQLGQTITKRVLLDWRDPDGDNLILVDAWKAPTLDDEITFTPDGQVTFRDIGKTTGTKTIHLKVSDGYAVTEGTLTVTVTADTVAPIAYGDFETVAVGKTVTIYPLANDLGANLSLSEVTPGDCGCAVKPNYREKWFTFTAEKAGVYYVTYKVTNGPIALGLVRIDVRARSENHPPVAALDVALLPPGGSVMIDPLLNDSDADGDVLVVQSVSQSPGLELVLERRHLLTISAKHAPKEPVTLTYWLSDGKYPVQGTIIVMPTPSTGSVEPQAARDEVRVRAGSTQAVDVLANDTSPIGLELTLDALVENPLKDRAWIDGNAIQVSVPPGAQASTITLTYQIKDSDGAIASNRLTVTVVSEDAQNEPPVPRQVVERVLAGTTTRLAIPLAGIDPNGDAVRLVGLGSGPSLGRVLATGNGWLSYEAFKGSKGTDVFSYQVIDSLGAVATGEIRVGIAPAGRDNNPPTAVADEIRVRPGSHVQLSALRNDIDVDGDEKGYVASDPVEIAGVEDIEIIDHLEISFVAPEKEGTYPGKYYIEDSRGLGATGDLTVIVDEKAPLLAPEARDDLVSVAAVVGKDWVEVDALSNDFDPDGPREDLRVSVPSTGAPEDKSPRATGDGTMVTAPVTDRMQQIRYLVTDADGLTDTGLIILPGRNDSVPVLKNPDEVISAIAGQPVTIDINHYVMGTAGRQVRLTSVDSISQTNGQTLPGPQRIDYIADVTYEGPASVVFEVSDVVAEGDKTARRAYISLPITVKPAPNRPDEDETDIDVAKTSPELVGAPPLLTVGPGEGEARLDLIPYFRDPDGDSFFFEGFSHADGSSAITWRTSDDGSKLYASTDIATQRGTSRTLNARAVDANGGETPFQIRLDVIASTRPLADAVADVVPEALAGQETTVPVLSNDKSNLIDRPELTLVPDSARIINGAGSIKTAGDVVKVTPAAGFVGTLTASYTIMDATKDPGRRVDGTIRLTVKDKPSRPGAPREGTAGNGTVTFTYTPGSSNGYDIMARTAVAVTAGGQEIAMTQCKSTTCTITGLPNGKPYQFKVQEANQAGVSEWSPLSGAYTPDVKPLAPAAPTIVFGDKQLTVAWQEPGWEDPSNPGSPINKYFLALLDESGKVLGKPAELAPTARTHVWTGLTNGTRYRFKVMARNAAGESPYSDMSGVEWPAGPASASPLVVATATENPLGGAFSVAWQTTGIDPNGDPVKEFIVTPVSQSGQVPDKARVVAVSGQATQTVLIEGLGQIPYKFRVEAVNKAGRGVAAGTPQWQTAWELPKIKDFRATPGDGSIQMVISHNFAGRQEASPVLQYSLGDSWEKVPMGGLITGLTNGRSYDVSVRLVIEGDRQSAPVTVSNLMPVSAVPGAVSIEERSLAFAGYTWDGDPIMRFRTQPPTTLIDSGGWDLEGYWYKCGNCTPSGVTTSRYFTFASSALKSGSASTEVTFGHDDAKGESWTTSVSFQQPVSGGSYTRADGEPANPPGTPGTPDTANVKLTLRHVTGTTCTIDGGPKWPDGEKTITQGSGDTFVIDKSVVFAIGDKAPGAVTLTCKNSYLNQSFDLYAS